MVLVFRLFFFTGSTYFVVVLLFGNLFMKVRDAVDRRFHPFDKFGKCFSFRVVDVVRFVERFTVGVGQGVQPLVGHCLLEVGQ